MTVLAYLDPGTGTLIVQAVLGGTAGVAVLFKTFGKRFSRKSKSTTSEEHSENTHSEGPDLQAPNLD